MSVFAWLHWCREIRRLERDARSAYRRWMRAHHAYADTVVVFSGQPGAWSDTGPCGKAGDEVQTRMNEYLDLSARVRRLWEVGP